MINDLECGCRQEHDESGEMPVTLVEQCALHDLESAELEAQLARRLGYELDLYVSAVAKGKRVKLIRGPDDSRGL